MRSVSLFLLSVLLASAALAETKKHPAAEPRFPRSALTSSDLLLVKGRSTQPCLDELPAGDDSLYRLAGEVTPPVVKRRVEPDFPNDVRGKIGRYRESGVIAEAVITKAGCVRSVRLLTQTPYPSLNAAAVVAMSKWQFEPGRLNGQPVDVVFNLTIRFLVE